jgi:hypothetical protein
MDTRDRSGFGRAKVLDVAKFDPDATLEVAFGLNLPP